MKLHVLQHVAFEGAANILKWAELKGHSVTTTRFFEMGWEVPPVAEVDCLFIMGGPMSVYEESEHAFLIPEKTFIRAVIDAGKPVLGICLGAQLCADVLGAKVYPMGQKEIGWYPVSKVAPHPIFFDMNEGQHVFHWHGDTFDLPMGSILLASSAVCKHQAFMWKEQVMGLQFHMEMTPDDIQLLIENCFEDLKMPGPHVQKDGEIQKHSQHADILAGLLDSVLTRFVS